MAFKFWILKYSNWKEFLCKIKGVRNVKKNISTQHDLSISALIFIIFWNELPQTSVYKSSFCAPGDYFKIFGNFKSSLPPQNKLYHETKCFLTHSGPTLFFWYILFSILKTFSPSNSHLKKCIFPLFPAVEILRKIFSSDAYISI